MSAMFVSHASMGTPVVGDNNAEGCPVRRAQHWPRGRDVHVWTIDLAAPAAGPADWLDRRELERAHRFVYAHDSTRYVRAHLALRAILGAYLGREPAALNFVERELGKPRLLPEGGECHFNLSHSKDKAMVVVGAADEVGVDIEAVRDDLPGEDLASAVLCEDEMKQLASFPEGERAQPFVTCWTRKEACLKALGLGLSLQPRNLHVGFGLARKRLTVAGCDLDIEALPVPAGYRAAVAALGGLGEVHMFDLNS